MKCVYSATYVFLKDSLGPTNLSTVERLSTHQRYIKCISTMGKSAIGAAKVAFVRRLLYTYMVSFILSVL